MIQIKNIGLIGFGVVGEGVYHVIHQTPGLQVCIKKIGVKQAHKNRNAPENLFTTDLKTIIDDPEIDTIVELIDDADAAFEIVRQSITRGKNVVTANKKMLAFHLTELIMLQRKHKVSLLYEAAVCGSIPILRNLEEYYNNDLLQSISGIVNGSTNFILTAMCDRQIPYAESLLAAQQAGFAESDPALDVEGFDAQNKLTLLLKHTFGLHVKPAQIFRKGITGISGEDINYAREKGLSVKLLAKAFFSKQQKIVAYVLPQFIQPHSQLSHVHNEYNGILIGSMLADEQFLYGKGAGRYPTASAVLSDISALNYGYRYEYKKSDNQTGPELETDYNISVYVSWKGEARIDKSLFTHISAVFSGDSGHYLTGVISLANLQLISSSANVSVIEMPAVQKSQKSLVPLIPERKEVAVLY